MMIDWRNRQQSRAEISVAIKDALMMLPERYTPDLYRTKCDVIYQHIYDSYYGEGHSVYAVQ